VHLEEAHQKVGEGGEAGLVQLAAYTKIYVQRQRSEQRE